MILSTWRVVTGFPVLEFLKAKTSPLRKSGETMDFRKLTRAAVKGADTGISREILLLEIEPRMMMVRTG